MMLKSVYDHCLFDMLRSIVKRRWSGNHIQFSLQRSFSYHFNNQSLRNHAQHRIWPWVTGISTITLGGCGLYMYKSSSIQVLEFAKQHKQSPSETVKWRDAIAAALIDLANQKAGCELILKQHWGSTLGTWISEDIMYMWKMGLME